MPDSKTEIGVIESELEEVGKILGSIDEQMTGLRVQRDRMVILSGVFTKSLKDLKSLPEQLELPLSD
jgi:oligoribonuclease (3'-5' exoribonuclease)